jgi:hypothetical protein
LIASTAMSMRHFVADVRRVLAHVEVGALDGVVALAPMASFFSHRVRHGEWKRSPSASPAWSRPSASALPSTGDRLVAFEDHLGRLEGRGRVLGGVEEVFALDVLVEQWREPVSTDLVSITMSTSPVFAALVERDRAGGLVEAAQLGRVAEMAVREAREAVVAVEREGFRRGQRRGGSGDGEDEGGEFFKFFMGILRSGGLGLLAWCGDTELDQDMSLATMSNLAQAAFADGEIAATDGEAAVEDAAIPLRREGGGDDDLLRLALDA